MAALGVGLVLLAGVGGGLLVQQRLNTPWLRRAVIASVERQSGRAMTLGRVQVRLLPTPHVQADDLALADRPGSVDPEMLRIDHMSAAIAVWPLFRHVVQFDALKLDHVTLHVVRDADGHGNWEMKPEPRAAGGSASRGHAARWGAAFGSVRVDAADITLRDFRDHRGGDLYLGTLAATGLQGEQPQFSLAGVAHGAGYAVQGSTGPLRRLFGGTDRRTAWPISLQATESIGGSAVGHGGITGSLTDPAHGRGYDLTVSLAVAQLANLNRLFAHAGLPDMQGLDAAAHVVDDGHPALMALQVKAGPTDLGRARDLKLQGWSLAAPSRDAALDVSASGNWRGQALELKGNVASLEALDGMLSSDRRAGGDAHPQAVLPVSVPVRLSLGLGGSAWRIEGRAGAGESDLRLQGSVQDTRTLSAAAPDLGPVTVAARLQTEHGSIFRLTDLQLASGAGDLQGALTLALQGRPVLSGALRSSHIDMNRLAGSPSPTLPPAPATPPAPAAPPAPPPQPAGSPQALPWPVLRAGNADLSLQAGDVLIGALHYRNLATHAVLRDGRLLLDPLEASGPAGAIAARLQADAAASPPVLSVWMHPMMLPASSLTALLGWPDAAGGAVELVGQLQASGTTRAALAGSLQGHVGLSMTDGWIANTALSRLTGPSPVSAALSGTGETTLRCLAIHAALAGGQASIDTLSLRTGRLSVDGHGRLGLADGGLDLRLLPDARVGGAWASLPMRVTGSLRDPHPALDAAASGGRYALTIGSGGGAEPDCAAPLQAAREGLAGPAVSAIPPPEPGGKRKAPKPIDILRGLGILH
jgi:AsmA protein